MDYKILVDGVEQVVKKQVRICNRQDDNKVREEIIRYYLDEEGACEVRIIEAYEEEGHDGSSLDV